MLGRRSGAPGRDGATNLPSWAAVFEARANVVSFGPPQRQAKPCSVSSGANPPPTWALPASAAGPHAAGCQGVPADTEAVPSFVWRARSPRPRASAVPDQHGARVLAGFSTPRFVGGAWRQPGCCSGADLAQAVPTRGLMSVGPGWLAGCTGPLSSSL